MVADRFDTCEDGCARARDGSWHAVADGRLHPVVVLPTVAADGTVDLIPGGLLTVPSPRSLAHPREESAEQPRGAVTAHGCG